MTKEATPTTKLTRGDKAQKKFMEKFDVLKTGMMHGIDSFTTTQKQTLEAATKEFETIAKTQESERTALYQIIKTCEDTKKVEKAYERLAELDLIAENAYKEYTKLAQTEREIANGNISGVLIFLAFAGGFLSTKQLKKIGGKALSTVSKNIPQLKR